MSKMRLTSPGSTMSKILLELRAVIPQTHDRRLTRVRLSDGTQAIELARSGADWLPLFNGSSERDFARTARVVLRAVTLKVAFYRVVSTRD